MITRVVLDSSGDVEVGAVRITPIRASKLDPMDASYITHYTDAMDALANNLYSFIRRNAEETACLRLKDYTDDYSQAACILEVADRSFDDARDGLVTDLEGCGQVYKTKYRQFYTADNRKDRTQSYHGCLILEAVMFAVVDEINSTNDNIIYIPNPFVQDTLDIALCRYYRFFRQFNEDDWTIEPHGEPAITVTAVNQME